MVSCSTREERIKAGEVRRPAMDAARIVSKWKSVNDDKCTWWEEADFES